MADWWGLMSNEKIKRILRFLSGATQYLALPTFANATEMTTGVDGITITPSNAFAAIGRTTSLARAFTFSTSISPVSVIITFPTAVVADKLSFLIGPVGGYYNALFVSLSGSNDLSSWTTLYYFNNSTQLDQVSFSNTTKYKYYKFIYRRPDGVTGATCEVGGINLYYTKEIN